MLPVQIMTTISGLVVDETKKYLPSNYRCQTFQFG